MAVHQGRRSIPLLAEPAHHKHAGRIFDILLSLVAILFFLPVMVVIALMVYVTNPGPILFGQSRIGRGARSFRCWKFRSMVVDAEARLPVLLASDPQALSQWQQTHKLLEDPRITRFGSFLRRSSLDELPQIFNVLIGDMSWVGPRPIVEAEVHHYGRYFFEYCRVRPGITGLWQVSGRNDVSYRRRVALDISYARSKSLRLDAKILLLTVPRVLRGSGCY